MPSLSDFPLSISQLTLFALILLGGLVGGELAARTRILPRIVGYIAVGLALGPAGLGWLEAPLLAEARGFVDIALGLVWFELGRCLDLAWLRQDRAIVHSALAEGGLAFALILMVLLLFGFPPLPAALAASIGMATSPAVVLVVARDLGAEGALTRRVLTLVALGNVLALALFTLLAPFAQDPGGTLGQALYQLIGSPLLGLALFGLAGQLARLTAKREAGQFVLLAGVLVLAIALARSLALSVMLSLLAFGIAARNLDRARRLIEVDFGLAIQLFCILLFVITGAYLRLDGFASAGLVILAFLGARLAGKGLGLLLCAPAARQTGGQAVLTALALVPMAGVALGMAHSVGEFNPELAGELTAVVLAAAAVLDLLGPIATQFALRRAGDARPEAGP